MGYAQGSSPWRRQHPLVCAQAVIRQVNVAYAVPFEIRCTSGVHHTGLLCLQAIIRPWRLDKVVEQLNASGIRGMTVEDVRGAGVQGGEQR